MSYQERIYNQNGKYDKNLVRITPKTSSDICIFNRPSFIMSGASTIDCPEVTCNINNIPYNDLFTGTTNCFTLNGLSGSCFNGINWITSVYENDVLSYSNTFYTSMSLTGSVIDITTFSGSVVTAFDTLGYDYSFDGTGFTINKEINIENIRLELRTELDYDSSCLPPFTGTCSTNEVVCDLDFSGLTLTSDNVHLLTGQTTFDLIFNFTGNTSSFIDNDAKFRYDIYKFIPELSLFNKRPILSSDYFTWDTFSGTSAFTTSITADTLQPDGQYLIKGHFLYNICTEFANKLGYNHTTSTYLSGENYGIYEPSRDMYFIVFSEADKPNIQNGEIDSNALGALTVASLLLDGSTNEFNLPYSPGDFIIALNGLTLAPGEDYVISTIELSTTLVNNLKLSGQTISGDVLTYVYTNSETNNNIKLDTYDINTPIVSGTTNNEGLNKVYYNTDTNKYEIFLTMTPISNNDIGVTLNGITLANKIDYYQSISNPRRIILEGEILLNDIINVYYNTNTNIQGSQFGTSMNVSWNINNAPQTNDGLFVVELSENDNFTTIVSSATTTYSIGATNYGVNINLVGELGDKLYYRVKNYKKFNTLCNETLTSINYSDIIPITIQTNLNNSY